MNITAEGVIDENNTTLAYTIKHPLSFINNSIEPRDWYTDNEMNQNSTLWANDTKTHYDPCPQGWRIPPDGTWSDFTRTDNAEQPLNGTFPFYIKGVAKENGGVKDFHQTNGSLYKATLGIGTPLSWYPVTGYRHSTSGTFYYVGSRGYYWSASISSTSSVAMSYNMSELFPNYMYRRACGFPVRCVQE